jgi:hypothetical protein
VPVRIGAEVVERIRTLVVVAEARAAVEGPVPPDVELGEGSKVVEVAHESCLH